MKRKIKKIFLGVTSNTNFFNKILFNEIANNQDFVKLTGGLDKKRELDNVKYSICIVDAIFECSNEQESWKPELPPGVKYQSKVEQKRPTRQHNQRFYTQIKSPVLKLNKEEEKFIKKKGKPERAKKKSFYRKKNPNHKGSINKSRLSSHSSFIKTPDQKCSNSNIKLSVLSKKLEGNTKVASKSKKFKHQHLFSKEGYNTMRINKNKSNIEHNTSVRPPTYKKVSPGRVPEKVTKDLRFSYASPKTPIHIPFKSYSLIRECSLEERREVQRKPHMKNHTISAKLNNRRQTVIHKSEHVAISPDVKRRNQELKIDAKKISLKEIPKKEFSNKDKIKQIIRRHCLPGKGCFEERNKLYQLIDTCNYDYFIAVFGQKKLLENHNFKAIFGHNCGGIIHRLYGGEDLVEWMINNNISRSYHYDLQQKEFKEIPSSKSVDSHTDAVVLMPSAYFYQPVSCKISDWLSSSNALAKLK